MCLAVESNFATPRSVAEIVYNKRFIITAFQYCFFLKKKKRNSRAGEEKGPS